MKLFRDLSRLPDAMRSGAVTIGNFDGVHRGHARIVQRLLALARKVSGPALVFTFDPHPVRLLRPAQAPPPLTWTDRKAELLAALGVDAVLAYPTDNALLELSDQAFFDEIVCRRLGAKAVVEGSNFYFGRDRMGNVETLARLTAQKGQLLEIVEPVQIDGQNVSSSRIRGLIATGDVAQAARLLTEPYRIRGMVTHGDGRGAKLGFPTANVEAIDTLLPAHGVYAGRAIVDGQRLAAAINLGPAPTFRQALARVEVHIIDRELTLYGQPLEVEFLAQLREVRTFASVEDLLKQVADDVAQARSIVRTATG